jgi:hypothetical protein
LARAQTSGKSIDPILRRIIDIKSVGHPRTCLGRTPPSCVYAADCANVADGCIRCGKVDPVNGAVDRSVRASRFLSDDETEVLHGIWGGEVESGSGAIEEEVVARKIEGGLVKVRFGQLKDQWW